jgi:hypothetical protein
LALWDYGQRSAAFIFGNAIGDKAAEAILNRLRASPDGMTRGEIRRQVFGDNKSAEFVGAKLTMLVADRLIRTETVETAGRSTQRFFAVTAYVKNVINVMAPGPGDSDHVDHVNHVAPPAENTVPNREFFEI